MPRASLHARDAIACCPIAHGHAAGHVDIQQHLVTFAPPSPDGQKGLLLFSARVCEDRGFLPARFTTNRFSKLQLLHQHPSRPVFRYFRGGMDRRTRATFTPARRLSAAWKRHRARPYWLAATSLAPQARACLLSCGRACVGLLDHTQVLTLIFSTSQRAALRAIPPSPLATQRLQKSLPYM